MATSYTCITEDQAALIEIAPLFFVASAAPDMAAGPAGQGAVNLSPKGGTPLHIIDANRVAYLDYQGSGNQTARHARRAARLRSWSWPWTRRCRGSASLRPCPRRGHRESELAPLLLGAAPRTWSCRSARSSTSRSRAPRRAAGTACRSSTTWHSGCATNAVGPTKPTDTRALKTCGCPVLRAASQQHRGPFGLSPRPDDRNGGSLRP